MDSRDLYERNWSFILTFPLRDLEVIILECLVIGSRVGLICGVSILKLIIDNAESGSNVPSSQPLNAKEIKPAEKNKKKIV